MSVSTNDLKNGMSLNLPEGLMTVVEFQHVKPGKGGAFVRTKLKNFRTGAVIERTYRADEKLALAVIDKREMQYLYRENTSYVFMDNENYEQLQVNADDLGDAVNYIKEGDSVILPVYNDAVVGVELPASVELLIAETEPGVQGDRVSGARKPATLETGLDRASAPVHRGWRAHQGRYPHGRVPRARLTSRPMATRREAPRTGPRPLLRARDPGHGRRRRARRATGSARRVRDRAGARRRRASGRDRRAAHAAIRSTGPSTGCRPSTARCCASGRTNSGGATSLAPGVVINEAVELAQEYSTKDSGRFVNGLLSRIAEHLQEA